MLDGKRSNAIEFILAFGDNKNKKSQQRHRMIDPIRDRIEELQGKPVEYTEKGRLLFSQDINPSKKLKHQGIFGNRYGFMGDTVDPTFRSA
jgi:hypothetical protein